MGGSGKFFATAAGAAAFAASSALADNAPLPNPFSALSNANAVVLAIRSEFAPAGGHVRVTVYDGAENFLDTASGKFETTVNDDGVALLTLEGIEPGEYAFVAYFDENGDGKLNRNLVGKPKEPFIFSNDVRPKLRKPTFAETKVAVAPGEVVVLTLKD